MIQPIFAMHCTSFIYPSCDSERQNQDEQQNPTPVFAPLDAAIYPGDFVVVCGASGSGKTTLLRMLNPLLTLAGTQTGTITYDGKKLHEVALDTIAQEIAFVQQFCAEQIIFEDLYYELSFTLENLGYTHDIIARNVAETAQYFGITHWLDRRSSELSGGQQQIVNIAAATIGSPRILILDEPTAQLDEVSKTRLYGLLARLNSELGITIIVAEHALDDLLPMATSVIELDARNHRSAQYDVDEFVRVNLADKNRPMHRQLPLATRAWAACARAWNMDFNQDIPLTIADGQKGIRTLIATAQTSANCALHTHCQPLTSDAHPTLVSADAHNRSDTAHPTHPKYHQGKQTSSDYSNPSIQLQAATHLPQCTKHIEQSAEKRRDGYSNDSSNLTSICSLKHVYASYPGSDTPALADINLKIHQNEIHALVGGNGSGKSTVLKVISHMMKAQAGKVRLSTDRLSYVPQDVRSMFSTQRVFDEVMNCLPSHNRSSHTAKDILNQANLTHRADHHPFDLSMGEMQRLALELALISQPELLLLDEPGKGLDTIHKADLIERLRTINSTGTSIVCATHDLDMAAQLAHRITMITPHTDAITATTTSFFCHNHLYTTPTVRLTRGLQPTLPTCLTFANLLCALNERPVKHRGDAHA